MKNIQGQETHMGDNRNSSVQPTSTDNHSTSPNESKFAIWVCGVCDRVNVMVGRPCHICGALQGETKEDAASGWTCEACTYRNKCSATLCEMCLSTKEKSTERSCKTRQWTCLSCTFLNAEELHTCGMCNSKKNSEVLGAEEEKIHHYPQQQDAHSSWTCKLCQYINKQSTSTCGSCDYRREAVVVYRENQPKRKISSKARWSLQEFGFEGELSKQNRDSWQKQFVDMRDSERNTASQAGQRSRNRQGGYKQGKKSHGNKEENLVRQSRQEQRNISKIEENKAISRKISHDQLRNRLLGLKGIKSQKKDKKEDGGVEASSKSIPINVVFLDDTSIDTRYKSLKKRRQVKNPNRLSTDGMLHIPRAHSKSPARRDDDSSTGGNNTPKEMTLSDQDGEEDEERHKEDNVLKGLAKRSYLMRMVTERRKERHEKRLTRSNFEQQSERQKLPAHDLNKEYVKTDFQFNKLGAVNKEDQRRLANDIGRERTRRRKDSDPKMKDAWANRISFDKLEEHSFLSPHMVIVRPALRNNGSRRSSMGDELDGPEYKNDDRKEALKKLSGSQDSLLSFKTKDLRDDGERFFGSEGDLRTFKRSRPKSSVFPMSDHMRQEYNQASVNPNNEQFSAFFPVANREKMFTEVAQDLKDLDLDQILDDGSRQDMLVVQKRDVIVPRKNLGRRNPVKSLAARTDHDSYYVKQQTQSEYR